MKSKITPIYGQNRNKLSKVVPLDMPYSMFVMPTTYCNFRCIYCGYSLGYEEMKKKYDFNPQMMTLETYKKIIEQMKEFPRPLKMLGLTAQGEPLINKDIAKMVKIAKDANVAERIEIITNGLLLTKELSEQLIKSGLDTLRISLQGISNEKYEEICGAKIDFDEFMENIRYFYRNKKDTNLFVKVMDIALNEGEEELFYSLFENCSDRMFVEKMIPAYEGVEVTQDLDAEYDRYGRISDKKEVCPLPFYMMGVFPNGDVEPCDSIYKPIILGNIHEKKLLHMWNSQELKNFWIQQLENKRCDNNKCAMCCAPNDVAHPEDELDSSAQILLEKIKIAEDI